MVFLLKYLKSSTKYLGPIAVALSALVLLPACSGDNASDVSSLSQNNNAPLPDNGGTPIPENDGIADTCLAEPPVRLTVETAQMAPITSRDIYVNATLDLDGQTLASRIRGRGNTTWGMPKKPYRLNLNQSTALLEMPAARNWALLANYADKTLLRNHLAFCVSATLGMEYTPRSRFVELTLNGQYDGVYQLTEHIEVGPNKVNIGVESETSTGVFLEWDQRYLEEPTWFISSMGVPYVVKSDATPAQASAAEVFINDLENRLKTDFASFAEKVDIESFVNFYLVNELLRNNDALYYSSTFVFRRPDEKLRFGPVWDFDIAAGNIDYNGNWNPIGYWTKNTPYLQVAFRYPEFQEQVKLRWTFLRARLPKILEAITASAKALDESQQRNFVRWDILNTRVWPNPIVTGSYEGEIQYLQGWLQDRIKWLDGEFGTE